MVITESTILVYGLLFLIVFTAFMTYIMYALVKEEKQFNFACLIIIPHMMFTTLLPYNPIGGHIRAFALGEEHRDNFQIERSVETNENNTPLTQLPETD